MADLTKLKKGEKLSFTNYFTVESASVSTQSVVVTDTSGKKLTIQGDKLIADVVSAAQYDSNKNVSRTELAEILEGAGDVVFTVNFDKKPTAESVLASLKKGSKLTKKDAEAVLKGENRTLVGHLVSTEPKMGRSQVVDLEETGFNLKQVDHRTLNWLILKGTKYQVK
jgi:hypothetical protein